MKTTILMLCAVLQIGSFPASAQTLQRTGDRYELSYVSLDPGWAHDSAEAFTHEIGNVLKNNYPSKVLDPDVHLRVYKKNNRKLFRFVWSCRIVTATEQDADYYFDRRGTLLWGASASKARRKVNDEIRSSGKIQAMRENFGKGASIPGDFVRDSSSGSHSEGYWYVKEFFLVAPK
jgi:hypothetical protein